MPMFCQNLAFEQYEPSGFFFCLFYGVTVRTFANVTYITQLVNYKNLPKAHSLITSILLYFHISLILL